MRTWVTSNTQYRWFPPLSICLFFPLIISILWCYIQDHPPSQYIITSLSSQYIITSFVHFSCLLHLVGVYNFLILSHHQMVFMAKRASSRITRNRRLNNDIEAYVETIEDDEAVHVVDPPAASRKRKKGTTQDEPPVNGKPSMHFFAVWNYY